MRTWIGFPIAVAGLSAPAMLFALIGAAANLVPWAALPGVWLGGNALLGLIVLGQLNAARCTPGTAPSRHGADARPARPSLEP